MKQILLLITVLFTTGLSAQNVPNGGFENWVDGEPVGWMTYNKQLKPTILQSSSEHSGEFACLGDVDTLGANTVSPFLLSDSIGGDYGFPIAQKFGALQFWYRLLTDTGDIMPVIVAVRDTSGTNIGVGGVTFLRAESYTLATVPIYYSNSPKPAARAHISLTISDTAGTGIASRSSFYIIDDMMMIDPNGIEEQSAGVSYISVYPNPASGTMMLGYTLEAASAVDITLSDLTGRNVYSLHHSQLSQGIKTEQLEISGLAQGLYVCIIRTGTGFISRKVQVGK